jgi:peroxin-16
MNTMSMYHDTILAKVAENNPKYRPLIPSSLHTRYTKAWIGKNSQYKWAARILELLRFTELVIEMGLRRKVSEKLRWRGIVVIEMIK